MKKQLFFLSLSVIFIFCCATKSIAMLSPLHLNEKLRVVATPDDSIPVLICGYVPQYRISNLDQSNYNCLNRAYFFSLKPTSAGTFAFATSDSTNFRAFLSKITSGQQVFVTIGGGDNNSGYYFTNIAQDPIKMQNYVNAVANFYTTWQALGLTGIDLDWEGYNIGSGFTQPDSSLYRQLCQNLSAALHPLGSLFTAAIGVAPVTGKSSKFALAGNINSYVDGINVMAYGPNTVDATGNQSTLDSAKAYLARFVSYGIPANKLILGVPFFLSSKTATPSSYDYSWLVGQVPNLDSTLNLYTANGGTYGYNGIKCVESKVQYLTGNGYGGITNWDMGGDVIATSPYSLIGAIKYANVLRPTVNITAPANNATFSTGSNITLNATASSPNAGGSISKVDFYQGSTLLGTATSSPYSYTWNSVANGSYILTAVATDNNGLTTTAAAVNILVEATSFGPVADAYVRNGIYANYNYGTSTTLVVKSDGSSYFRESYLRFDYNSYTGSSVNSAQFKIYVSGVNTSPSRIISIYGIADTTWGETTITYNNQPTETGTLICNDTISNTSGIWYTSDVTSYINSQLAAGHKKVSFRLINNGTASSLNDVSFSSKEAAANNPQLVFTPQGPMAPVIAAVGGIVGEVSARKFNAVVYPNPSAATFNVAITGTDGSVRTDIWIIDMNGRVVKTLIATSSTTIQFGNDLHPGIYFVEIVQGTNKKVMEIIKL